MLFGRHTKNPIRIPVKPVAKWAYTTCGYCSTGCSIEVGLDAHGHAVTARGVADAPVNAGKLCLKGIFEHELFTSVNRGRGNNGGSNCTCSPRVRCWRRNCSSAIPPGVTSRHCSPAISTPPSAPRIRWRAILMKFEFLPEHSMGRMHNIKCRRPRGYLIWCRGIRGKSPTH